LKMDPAQSKHDIRRPRIVIVGAGFAGLSAAKALAALPADIVLIDRSNHHVFQPLLYQVATAALSPAQIAQPIRTILKDQANCSVELFEVTAVDVNRNVVKGNHSEVAYDYLIIATGATHTYFSHDDWSPYAPGLKSIEDALHIRQLILNAFEKAELSGDMEERKALMTFVLIGGGPTGVEMAGAIAELARHTLTGEFRRINPADARVILVEAAPRVLPGFPESLSARSQKDLEHLGVEVITGKSVTDCNARGARIDNNFILCHTIIWCAGVKASAASQWLGAGHDRAGRVIVNPDLSVAGHPNVFVIGDTAHIVDNNGITVPGLCPAAVQQGKYVAGLIKNKLANLLPPSAFSYKDKGIMATIGRGKAIAIIYNFKISGLLAWILWGAIHLVPLVGFRNRLVVGLDWFWTYLTKDRGVRLITTEKK
jgi:NADH:ubiquinone reductase (H+-translocating)